MTGVQDSHRQKNWASEQKEAASKDMGSRALERVSGNLPEAGSHSQAQPSPRDEGPRDQGPVGPLRPDSVRERGRIFQQDAQALAQSVRQSVELVRGYVSGQVEQRPYTTVGLAAGLGYVLGGGLASRITGTALGAAYRVGLALAARELNSRISMAGLGEEASRRQQPREEHS